MGICRFKTLVCLSFINAFNYFHVDASQAFAWQQRYPVSSEPFNSLIQNEVHGEQIKKKLIIVLDVVEVTKLTDIRKVKVIYKLNSVSMKTL